MEQSGDWHTEWGNGGKGSMWDSNFLCSKYDDRADMEANETDSWEMDHSCNIEKMIAMGDTEGGNWTSGIHGIQLRLITKYYEQR